MSRVGELGLGEVGVEAAAALRELSARSVAGSPVASYVTGEPLAWEAIRRGGWDLIGAPEATGGGDASLRDLVEVARAWGWAILPLPLIPTLMAKRWSASAHQGGVAVSVRTRASGDRGVAPFGAEPDVALLDAAGRPLAVASAACEDPYAPSLRLVECDAVTSLSADAARELAVVWAAEATGCAARMLHEAVAYAKERHQFAQPIGRFQAVKHHLANAHMMTEQAETAAIVASLEPGRATAATRFAFDNSLRVIEIAIQIHGGLGFTWEMGLHLYLRHVSTLRELAGGLQA